MLQCWLAETEGRRYWEIMLNDNERFSFDAVGSDDGCPFQNGLYQPMRNTVLAASLMDRGGAVWADVSVCVHPENHGVRRLRKPVCGSLEVIEAFNCLAPGTQIAEIDASTVVNEASRARPGLRLWASWMRERYLLAEADDDTN